MIKKQHLQMFVPLLIIVMVAGVWALKQLQPDFGVSFSRSDQLSLPANLQDADFSLKAKGAVDMEALSQQYHLPMIIDYGFDSCSPCQRMAPALETINADFFGKAFIKYVDVTDYPTADDELPVLVFPTQFFVNADGTPFKPSTELDESIHFSFYYDPDEGTLAYTTHQGVLTEDEMRQILKEMGVN
ncbi:MAG: thioredoxin family protein [Peptococcaceae bacterium]|nr:thioredoxin family protein [Peptococcaceae bacterium]